MPEARWMADTTTPGQDDLHYWKVGWLQPMDAYIADPGPTEADWNFRTSSQLRKGLVGGWQKLIGIVINAETSLLAYRKDLFTSSR